MRSAEKSHLSILDVLRAIAALSVCLFHFNNEHDLEFSKALTFGHYGVELFFVISGFIIPLSMLWAGYRHWDGFRFLLRRGIRLYPAFAIVVLLEILLLTQVRPALGYEGEAAFTWSRAIANFTLSCDFVNERWFLPVLWTLAQEAQFYVLIALTLPLLLSGRKWLQWPTLLLWIIPPYFLGAGPTIFSWSALFALGILACLKREKLIGQRVFWVFLGLAVLSHGTARNEISALLGVGAVLVILYTPRVRFPDSVVAIGTISYSLYLLHLIIGGAVQFNLNRLPESLQHPLISIVLATGVSIAGAAIFYKYVEEPSHNLSRKLKGKGRGNAR